jgi:hypothetical protein
MIRLERSDLEEPELRELAQCVEMKKVGNKMTPDEFRNVFGHVVGLS